MYLADFHTHSTFSDGKLSIPELVDLFGNQGFGAIAITDHLCDEDGIIGKSSRVLGASLTKATFPLYQEILKSETERAWEQYGMRIIPGLELTRNNPSNHRSSHILALGVTKWIRADQEVEKLIEEIHVEGGIAVAAHPVWTRKIEKQTFYLWDRKEAYQNLFDAWEVASGPYIFDEVKKSGLPMLASSDLHKPNQMTSWKTVLRTEKKQEAILQAIKTQKIDFQFYQEKKHGSRNECTTRPLATRDTSDFMGNLAFY